MPELLALSMGGLTLSLFLGLIAGNTGDDVLRETHTAVLAVKPAGFVSTVE